MSNFTPAWPPEAVAKLRKLWAEGFSASIIGRRMGRTRNAIIGKAHRLKLECRQSPSEPGKRLSPGPRLGAPKVKPQPRAKPPRPGPQNRPALVFGRATGKRAEMIAKAETLSATADIFGLNEATCRFPIGDPKAADFGYCGRPRERGAYCACHGARAYDGIPVKERRRDPTEDLMRAAVRWAA